MAEIMAAIAAIGFLCLVMTIPLTIGLVFLLVFFKGIELLCFGLIKFIDCVFLKEADKPVANIEVLDLRQSKTGELSSGKEVENI